ncbi:MAG: cysteate synthase, partial [ANME-2 cluster archaeon]|nr:cysteate synthase [ANME-2 cluster archaeon]
MNTSTISALQFSTKTDTKYTIECTGCSIQYPSDAMSCSKDKGLLRTRYASHHLHLHDLPGMGKFLEWLPVSANMHTQAGPMTYKSMALAREMGLSNLYIGFNGYWPEQGAHILTCSFKELEAHPTLQRMQESGHKKLVLASAGNTARAFAHAVGEYDIELYIVVPGSGLQKMWLPQEPTDNIHLISMGENCDYSDAIKLADNIAALPGMIPEGGARNVARRDGMGTVMLDGAVTIGRMPDHYFQAIGSGTGGIAAWEASLRLRADGRFGETLPRLHLVQNLPFAPMLHAWQHGRRDIIEDIDMPGAKKLIDRMYADVLSNRQPPYSMPGGVYDALTDTNG